MSEIIDVRHLRKGMYVTALDRAWEGTPFLFQGFTIQTDAELQRLRRLCRYVYIATDSQFDRPLHPALNLAPSREEPPSPHKPRATPSDIPQQPGEQLFAADPRTLEEELPAARALDISSRELAYTIMDDVRLGRSIDSDRARKLIAGMVESIARNPDALVWLTNLRKKDEYTALHSVRVAILALAFGHHLKLSIVELNILGLGALLHDIGKLLVPNTILNKPARLTPEEFAIMKTHVPRGVAILEKANGVPSAAIEVASSHHERYTGSGYIYGLSGNRIGLFGLIGAIVDSYDAMTSDRTYQSGISTYDALAKLYKGRGKDYHGGLVDQFIQCMGVYPIGSIVELSTGSIGVVISGNRQRRLRPKVALLFDATNTPYPHNTVIDLMHSPMDGAGGAIEIRRVLPPGTKDINPSDHLPA